MFQRFHEMREDREDGFTLIELLVVVLIIAILAAIAIPFFLSQRERSWDSQAQSALKNGATAMESHATQFEGVYPTTVSQLETQGYKGTAGVDLSISVAADGKSFCLGADHNKLGAANSVDWNYKSQTGKPATGPC